MEVEMTMSVLRRACLAGSLALVCASLVPAGPAGAADKVSLRLDWTLTGYQLPFYWAKQKGYFTAEGLDVEIKEGGGSGKTVALMAGQQDDIGFADYMLMAAGVAKGMKLKGIYGVVQNGAWAVISFADSPIRKPEELVGRSVAVTADHKPLLDLVLAANKVPADKISIRVVSAATRNTVFANGQVDSFVSIVIGSPLDLVVRARQGKGKPLHFMPFEDFGVAPLGQGVVVHEQMLAQKPELLQRFLKATTRALNEVTRKENFEEAVDIAMRGSGAAADRRDSVLLQWQEAIPRLVTKNTKGKPYGWMSEADWQEASDILLKTGSIDKPFPAQNFFTNALLPPQS
jgi:NitT/TauT family transport system substrate-binding protein